MSDYLIEGSTDSQISPHSSSWKLYGRTDNLQEAREIAAKAFMKTNYRIIRIREKS
jgi:hypothetical protein